MSDEFDVPDEEDEDEDIPDEEDLSPVPAAEALTVEEAEDAEASLQLEDEEEAEPEMEPMGDEAVLDALVETLTEIGVPDPPGGTLRNVKPYQEGATHITAKTSTGEYWLGLNESPSVWIAYPPVFEGQTPFADGGVAEAVPGDGAMSVRVGRINRQ